MNTRLLAAVFGMALLAGGACRGTERDGAGTASRDTLTTRFDRAVAVARAVKGHPAATDSVLAAHGFTRAGFDSLMYEIAADSQQSRAYSEAIR